MWEEFDVDLNGMLDREEAEKFVDAVVHVI
jgi:hypothetical protein